MSQRRFSRELLLQALFEYEFYPERDFSQVLNYAVEGFSEEKERKKVNQEFLEQTSHGIFAHLDDIKNTITTYAPEWPLDKINPVDRSILYIGVYEILFNDDIPDVVAINEAVELAKKYGDHNSSKFVNGVLNTVMQNKPK